MISSAVSFSKELGYTRFRCMTDPEPAIKAMVDVVIPKVTRVSVLWRAGTNSLARTNSSVATRHRRSIWVNRRCYSSVRAVVCETRHLAAEKFSVQTEWCNRVRKFERSVIQGTIGAIW